MCGLAGYNICLDEAKNLTEEKAKELARIGIVYNRHRGIDAHGWMATYSKELKHPEGKGDLYFFKAMGDGIMVEKSPKTSLPAGTPITLGVHTRDYTNGSPAHLPNNHPVSWGNVYVTHNGGISNHKEIKLEFGKGKNVPEVDSVAIPMLLSQISSPWAEDEVKKCLDEMGSRFGPTSAYTFHANWVSDPGLSLFALGKDRPLIVAWHPGRKIFVYGSEEDSVTEQLSVFGIKHDDDDLELGSLDDGKAILFYEGEPVWHYSFNVSRPISQGGRPKATRGRYDTNGEKIADNGEYSHYTSFGTPYSSTLFKSANNENIFSLNDDESEQPQWFSNIKTEGLKRMRNIFAPNFDNMFVGWPKSVVTPTIQTNGLLFFGWIGNKEFVFTDSGVLKDIFDWDYFNKDNMPWRDLEVVQEEERLAIDSEDFEMWLAWSSALVKLPIVGVAKPYTKNNGYGWIPGVGKVKASDATNPKDKGTTTTKSSEKAGGIKEIFPAFLSGPNPTLVRSAVNPSFVFTNDSMCGTHKQYFIMHDEPEKCASTWVMAKMMLASVESLDQMMEIYPDEISVSEMGKRGKHREKCDWYPDSEQQIIINHGHTESRFLVSETCRFKSCSMRRVMYGLPEIARLAMDEYQRWHSSAESVKEVEVF